MLSTNNYMSPLASSSSSNSPSFSSSSSYVSTSTSNNSYTSDNEIEKDAIDKGKHQFAFKPSLFQIV